MRLLDSEDEFITQGKYVVMAGRNVGRACKYSARTLLEGRQLVSEKRLMRGEKSGRRYGGFTDSHRDIGILTPSSFVQHRRSAQEGRSSWLVSCNWALLHCADWLLLDEIEII
jgi:hypothetical protein